MSLVILLRCAVSLLRCAALTVLLSRTVSLVILLSRAALTAVEVLHLTGHVMQSRHVTGHPVEVPHSADRAVEVLCLLALLVEMRCLTDHPVEMHRLADCAVKVPHSADHSVEAYHLVGHPVKVLLRFSVLSPLLWSCAVPLTVMFRASLLASGSFDFGVDCCWVLVSHDGLLTGWFDGMRGSMGDGVLWCSAVQCRAIRRDRSRLRRMARQDAQSRMRNDEWNERRM